MARRGRASGSALHIVPASAETPEPLAASIPLWALTAARVVAIEADGRRARIQVGDEVVSVAIDPSVHAVVLRGALDRGERAIVQRDHQGLSVIGVLRTCATPGVDEGEEYRLKARRIVIEADHEASMISGRHGLFVRALGQVETIAETITSRAAGVHKIIGRIIRLN